jgi:hypothetical protein
MLRVSVVAIFADMACLIMLSSPTGLVEYTEASPLQGGLGLRDNCKCLRSENCRTIPDRSKNNSQQSGLAEAATGRPASSRSGNLLQEPDTFDSTAGESRGACVKEDSNDPVWTVQLHNCAIRDDGAENPEDESTRLDAALLLGGLRWQTPQGDCATVRPIHLPFPRPLCYAKLKEIVYLGSRLDVEHLRGRHLSIMTKNYWNPALGESPAKSSWHCSSVDPCPFFEDQGNILQSSCLYVCKMRIIHNGSTCIKPIGQTNIVQACPSGEIQSDSNVLSDSNRGCRRSA